VSRILGHADLATTADGYAHLTPPMLGRTAAHVVEILARRLAAMGTAKGSPKGYSPKSRGPKGDPSGLIRA
jgi:hypothetical protein